MLLIILWTPNCPKHLRPLLVSDDVVQQCSWCSYVDSGVGAGIDSYYEYLLKAYIMLGDETYLDRFNKVLLIYIFSCPLVFFVYELILSVWYCAAWSSKSV